MLEIMVNVMDNGFINWYMDYGLKDILLDIKFGFDFDLAI